jgi:secreted PhoX family phosphatase
MNILVPRIVNNKLQIFDPSNGAIKRTMSLPSNATFSGPVASGDFATVSIHLTSGVNRSRTYNMKNGKLISDIQM